MDVKALIKLQIYYRYDGQCQKRQKGAIFEGTLRPAPLFGTGIRSTRGLTVLGQRTRIRDVPGRLRAQAIAVLPHAQ